MPWLLIHYVVRCELRNIQKKGERRWGRKDNAHGLTGFAGLTGLTGLTGLASVSSREGEVKKSFEKRISRFRDLSGLGAGGPFSTPPHGVYPPLVEFGVRFFPKMELQSQLLAKQHCSKIMRGFSRWSNVVGNLNMTEFGARCIIFILFYVTGGHVVPESTVVRYIRQKLLSFMETTHTYTHTSPVFMLESCYDCQCEAKGCHKKQFFVACSQRTKIAMRTHSKRDGVFQVYKKPLHHIQKHASNCI